jgi:seryl-tRNA synthetase
VRKKISAQEERLIRQQKEYENEVRQLSETIQRLENHLAEQTKETAEVFITFTNFLSKLISSLR